MRRILLVFLLSASTAHAGTVVVMADRSVELGAALEVALANRHVDVARSQSPTGSLRLDRAAAAQRAAVDAGADAAVWIELGEVCVVSADGRDFRHAPIGEASPRVFAAITTSLLDELFAPPGAGFTVDVQVNVVPTPGPTPAPTPMPGFAPVVRPAVATMTPPPYVDPMLGVSSQYPPRHDRTQFEIGPMLSPVTAGLEANVMFPLSPHWRFGAMGAINRPFDTSIASVIYAGALELRHIGTGTRRHFDLGFLGGGASDGVDPVTLAGLRLGWTWENGTSNTSLGFTPLIIFTGSDGDPVVPAIYGSLRWGFTL